MPKTQRIDLEHISHAVKEYKIGVIDIGSNSVRLVIFDGIKRAPIPVYNEKVLCALGRGLSSSGKLNPKGVEQAKASVGRFLEITKLLDVIELHVLATAAVRDAEDGAAFVEHLETKYRIHVDVITGQREARLAAMGVMSSFHDPEGLVGDLGGGSLELVTLADGEMGQQATMPIGPLRLMDEGGEKLDKIEKIIDKNLSALGWLGQKRMPNFYAVGGSFRMLAKMHMQRENYPLNIVHGYRVAASDMQKLIKEVLAMPVDKIAEIPGVASKRAGSVQPAALMLDRIINISHCEYVVFSVSGIREGYLYEKLSPYIQTQDALIASAVDLVMHDGKSLEYAKELCEWMTPLFPKEKVADYRLRLAICILSEIAYSIHTEYRAEGAFGRIIQSMLKSHSHTERVMMAVALYHRHQFKMKNNNKLLTLIDDKTRARARVIGVAANLAFHLSGGEAGALSDIKLRIEKNGKTNITIPKDLQNLMGDAVQKRIDGLSEAFKAFSSATR